MNGSEDLPEAYDYDLIIVGGGSGGLAAAKARLLCVVWVIVRIVTFLTASGSPWNLFEPLLWHFAH